MSNHFSMGAINKNTNTYEYPKIANKKYKYMCPCCENDVIFKNGKILKPHFAHYKSGNPCYYYDKPSETQIHKDAKMLMKSLLDNKKNICIHRNCNYCEQRHCGINFGVDYDIFDDEYNENTKAIIEYKFNYNNSNRSADVALVENDSIKYIFEICYKNKTKEENRPEPWFEISAENLINQINSGEIIDEEGNINIQCIRNYKCEECIEYEEDENQKLILHHKKLEEEKIENERRKRYFLIKEQERKWRENNRKEKEEIIRKEEERIRKEEEIIRKEKEAKLQKLCNCGIMIINICICENPKYEFIKLNNNFFCINCNKWKCRCK
jgi:hypothetical protein